MKKKLSDYAKECGVTYRTAWNRYRAGKIKNSRIDETGHVVIEEHSKFALDKVAIYARVSSSQNRGNLDKQVERLKAYAMAKGYCIVMIESEVGSGVNDNRKKLKKVLQSDEWGTLIVEHKDRLTRFGFNYIDMLVSKEGRRVEVVNHAEDEKTDLIHDLMAVIYSFGAKLYGLRRTKRKTEQIIGVLQNDSGREACNKEGT